MVIVVTHATSSIDNERVHARTSKRSTLSRSWSKQRNTWRT